MPLCDFIALRTQKRCESYGGNKCGNKNFCTEHMYTQQALEARSRSDEFRRESRKDSEKIASHARQTDNRTLTLKRNEYDLFEDIYTHIVFDKSDKKAYGNHVGKGKVAPLTSDQISLCQRNGWAYKNMKDYDLPIRTQPQNSYPDSASESGNNSDDNSDTQSGSVSSEYVRNTERLRAERERQIRIDREKEKLREREREREVERQSRIEREKEDERQTERRGRVSKKAAPPPVRPLEPEMRPRTKSSSRIKELEVELKKERERERLREEMEMNMRKKQVSTKEGSAPPRR